MGGRVPFLMDQIFQKFVPIILLWTFHRSEFRQKLIGTIIATLRHWIQTCPYFQSVTSDPTEPPVGDDVIYVQPLPNQT